MIAIHKAANYATFYVSSIKDLNEIIIPHFLKYPLVTQKYANFELFRLIVELINKKEHVTTEGLQKIIAIRYSLNKGLSDELKRVFPDVVPVARPLVKRLDNISPNWLFY